MCLIVGSIKVFCVLIERMEEGVGQVGCVWTKYGQISGIESRSGVNRALKEVTFLVCECWAPVPVQRLPSTQLWLLVT